MPEQLRIDAVVFAVATITLAPAEICR